MKHILTIPRWMPVSDNILMGAHRFTKIKLKKADANAIYWSMREQRIPTALKRRKIEVVIKCKPRGRMPDPTNFAKSLLDAMVKCRLVIDDSQRWCEYVTPIIKRGKGKDWGTEIIIEDCHD